MMRCASTLPSSTPHWSNESICQIAPCVKTLCSYSATSLPSAAGVSRSSRIVVGRPVAFEHAMRNEPVGRALRLHFLGRLAECQRFGLREDVREQDVVVLAKTVECLVQRR